MVEIKRIEDATPEDYAALGMKSGIEIHQQLATTKKLFCRCPVVRPYSEIFNAEILRHMRPTLSELGEYDGTALMEFKTKKEIIYQIRQDTVCTYEMDDTPPFELNLQALDIALEVTMLLNCNLVSEVHIARKQYLDGSIPTGFQRTTILGVDGWIPYRGKRIGIIQLGLEEDACREVSDVGHSEEIPHRPPRHSAHRDGDLPRDEDAAGGRRGRADPPPPRALDRQGAHGNGGRAAGRERVDRGRTPRRDQGRLQDSPHPAPRA